MNKHDFLQYGLHVLERPNHLIITTPQTFLSGDPAHFCVRSSGERVIFCDYGMTYNALELSLPNPGDAKDIIRKNLKKLDRLIKFTDYALHADVAEAQTGDAIGEFLNIFALLTTYRPRSVIEQDIDRIMDEVRTYLIKRFGSYEEEVRLKGLSGTDHYFDFAVNDHVFDVVVKPQANSTGRLLRKIHDVHAIHEGLQFNVFMNDEHKDSFEKESRILSSVCNIKPVSMMIA